MKKRLLSLFLIAVMLLSCGVLGASAEDKPELTFLITSPTYDIEGDVTVQAVRRISGYQINYEQLNGTEQLSLIISGDKEASQYDFINLSKARYNLMMSNEALTDITDLLDEYGPNIKAAYSTLWPAVTVDGRIYAIPSTAAQPNSLNASIMARKDLLDAIGYTEDKLPRKLDDFIQMLRDVQAAYPDMVPLTMAQGYIVTPIASAYNLLAEQAPYQYLDGHVISVLDNPNLEKYLETMRMLYNEHLIDIEMPALDATTASNKWAAGQAVMLYASWKGCDPYIAAMRELFPDMDYEILPLLEDENGKVHAQVYYGVGSYGGFPVTSKNTVDTIKAINTMMEDANYKELVLGVEGVHWEYRDGAIYPIQPAFNDEKNNSNSFLGGLYREDVYPIYWEVRLKKNNDIERCFYGMRDSLLDGGEQSPTAIAPTVTVVDNLNALETRIKDTLVAIVSVSEDMSALQSLRDYWNANGGDQVVEFYDTWYNENIANK